MLYHLTMDGRRTASEQEEQNMDSRMRQALDRYITGNWGEDQFRDDAPEGMSTCEVCGEAVHNDQIITGDEANLGEYTLVCLACWNRWQRTME